ncbi:MAG: hypothetical protein ACK5XN_00985 [Bacteroidota bacterium]
MKINSTLGSPFYTSRKPQYTTMYRWEKKKQNNQSGPNKNENQFETKNSAKGHNQQIRHDNSTPTLMKHTDQKLSNPIHRPQSSSKNPNTPCAPEQRNETIDENYTPAVRIVEFPSPSPIEHYSPKSCIPDPEGHITCSQNKQAPD